MSPFSKHLNTNYEPDTRLGAGACVVNQVDMTFAFEVFSLGVAEKV